MPDKKHDRKGQPPPVKKRNIDDPEYYDTDLDLTPTESSLKQLARNRARVANRKKKTKP